MLSSMAYGFEDDLEWPVLSSKTLVGEQCFFPCFDIERRDGCFLPIKSITLLTDDLPRSKLTSIDRLPVKS